MKLVIVESPTKAKTIKKFLGPDYQVESCMGHIRDLPQSAKDIPEKYKKEEWSRLGVNVEEDFAPLYVVASDKKKKITELKKLLKECDELLLATDEDREGEAISWHLLEVLKLKVPVKRMVFHEITKQAILDSIEHKLFTLPGATTVHTGHGDSTRIEDEAANLEEWKKAL